MKSYAIIVPCYNEALRFPYKEFLSFAKKHPEVLLCFVNDGSRDNTPAVLRGIQYECPGNIRVYSLKQNGGKSEAVRQGMLYMQMKFDTELPGFLDADLATTADEWLQMAKYKQQLRRKSVKTTLQKGLPEFLLINRTVVRSLMLKMKHAVKIPFQVVKQYCRCHVQANFGRQVKTLVQFYASRPIQFKPRSKCCAFCVSRMVADPDRSVGANFAIAKFGLNGHRFVQ